MQFQVLIDGELQYTAGVSGEGHLGVHVNTRPPFEVGSVVASGYENLPSDETMFYRWKELSLRPGSEVTIRVVSHEVTSPSEARRSSSEDARVAVRSPETAREVHQRVLALQEDLLSMLSLLDAERPEDVRRFKVAVGSVLTAFGEHFLGPLYNAHPSLRPAELKGVPL